MVVGAQLTAGKCVSFSFEGFFASSGNLFLFVRWVVLLRSAAVPFFLQLNLTSLRWLPANDSG